MKETGRSSKDQRTKPLALFLRPKEKIGLPELHILVTENKEEDCLIGHCLDFNIYAVSQENSYKGRFYDVINQIIEVSLKRISDLSDENKADQIYAHRLPVGSKEWALYGDIIEHRIPLKFHHASTRPRVPRAVPILRRTWPKKTLIIKNRETNKIETRQVRYSEAFATE